MPLITLLAQCESWLSERLADGPEPYAVLRIEARQLGYTHNTLQRASRNLGIIKRQVPAYPGGRTTWSLPE